MINANLVPVLRECVPQPSPPPTTPSRRAPPRTPTPTHGKGKESPTLKVTLAAALTSVRRKDAKFNEVYSVAKWPLGYYTPQKRTHPKPQLLADLERTLESGSRTDPLDAVRKVLDKLRENFSVYRGVLEAVQKVYEGYVERLEETTDEVRALTSRLDEANHKITVKKRELEELKSLRISAPAMHLDADVGSPTNSPEMHESVLSPISYSLGTPTAAYRGQQEAENILLDKLSATMQRNEELENTVSDLLAEKDRLSTNSAQLQYAVDLLREENAKLQDSVKSLSDENEALKDENQKTCNSLDSLRSVMTSDRLRSNAAKLAQRWVLQTKQKSTAALKGELEKMQSDRNFMALLTPRPRWKHLSVPGIDEGETLPDLGEYGIDTEGLDSSSALVAAMSNRLRELSYEVAGLVALHGRSEHMLLEALGVWKPASVQAPPQDRFFSPLGSLPWLPSYLQTNKYPRNLKYTLREVHDIIREIIHTFDLPPVPPASPLGASLRKATSFTRAPMSDGGMIVEHLSATFANLAANTRSGTITQKDVAYSFIYACKRNLADPNCAFFAALATGELGWWAFDRTVRLMRTLANELGLSEQPVIDSGRNTPTGTTPRRAGSERDLETVRKDSCGSVRHGLPVPVIGLSPQSLSVGSITEASMLRVVDRVLGPRKSAVQLLQVKHALHQEFQCYQGGCGAIPWQRFFHVEGGYREGPLVNTLKLQALHEATNWAAAMERHICLLSEAAPEPQSPRTPPTDDFLSDLAITWEREDPHQARYVTRRSAADALQSADPLKPVDEVVGFVQTVYGRIAQLYGVKLHNRATRLGQKPAPPSRGSFRGKKKDRRFEERILQQPLWTPCVSFSPVGAPLEAAKAEDATQVVVMNWGSPGNAKGFIAHPEKEDDDRVLIGDFIRIARLLPYDPAGPPEPPAVEAVF